MITMAKCMLITGYNCHRVSCHEVLTVVEIINHWLFTSAKVPLMNDKKTTIRGAVDKNNLVKRFILRPPFYIKLRYLTLLLIILYNSYSSFKINVHILKGEKQMQLTETDFKEHLQEQIEFLKASSNSYDNGFTAEAKRLASVIRVLLHDTDRSQSLLKLLNRKNMHFYDSSIEYSKKNLLAHMGLILMATTVGPEGGASEYLPLLDDVPPYQRQRKKSFNNWWSKQIVLEDSKKRSFTRKDIVLGLANKDGGAHVDPKLNEKYASLTRLNSVGWEFTDGTNSTLILGAEKASMRQIAHEVIKTFQGEFPEYFN